MARGCVGRFQFARGELESCKYVFLEPVIPVIARKVFYVTDHPDEDHMADPSIAYQLNQNPSTIPYHGVILRLCYDGLPSP